VTHYLQITLAKSPPGEQRQLIASARAVLNHLEQQLDSQQLAADQDPALLERESAASAATADASLGAPRPASRSLSTPSGPPQAAGAAMEVNGADQRAWSVTRTDSHAKGFNRQPGSGTAQERPGLRGNTGSVLGLTMDEARRLGYCPK
jgi:hypothetical protein